MRKSLTLSTFLIFLLSMGLLSFISIEPIPVYSQDIQNNLPDLSGINIYFSEANNEYSQFDRSGSGISHLAGLLRLSGANLFILEWRKGIPTDADLIIIPAPTRDPASDQIARLWSYLESGGNVLVIADAFDDEGEVTRALGSRGLFELTWNDLGIQARSDVIVLEGDTRELDIEETDSDGNVTFAFSGELPELVTQFQTNRVDETHPITSDLIPMLDSISASSTSNLSHFFFDGARSIEIAAPIDDFDITPLIFSDPDMYGEINFERYLENGFAEYNIGEDGSRGNLVVAAAYENTQSSARMVLISDGDFVRDGAGFDTSPSYSRSFVYPMNVQFTLNSIAWLLERETVILDLPTPGATATATITPTSMPESTATPENGD